MQAKVKLNHLFQMRTNMRNHQLKLNTGTNMHLQMKLKQQQTKPKLKERKTKLNTLKTKPNAKHAVKDLPS